MASITIKNLHFSYDKKTILKEINTDVGCNEIIALLGPNGSGKSTLMKCINKILPYHKGNICIDGEDIKDYSQQKIASKVAYVPQYETKISGVKVFDMILSGRMPHLAWRPSENDYRIVAEVIDRLGLSSLAMNDFGAMSGGQQQMVYIARAIVQETPIILLDEPINNLDLRHQVEIMNLLKELSSQGKTILITLHDINLALQYCQKYILLKNGQIFTQGGLEIITTENLEQVYGLKMSVFSAENSIFINPYCG